MAATKTSRTLLTSQSLAAATAVNATEWNLSTAYGGLLMVRLTNGSSAPTTAPVLKVYAGDATGVKRQYWTASGDTTNSSVNDYPINLPPACMFCNITITNGATNAITVEAYGEELTSV